MKDILDKISSYNLFNYLLPGILFVYISKYFTDFDFVQTDTLIGAFFYYFVGMIVSRFGSLFIEPILKKIGFLKFADYKNYVSASKLDSKIELFSEINNTYRTLISTMFLLGVLKFYKSLYEIRNQIYTKNTEYIACRQNLSKNLHFRKTFVYLRVGNKAKSDTHQPQEKRLSFD